MGTQGDSFFVAFADAGSAVAAAGEVQAALAGGQMRVRIGIHTGEAVVTDEGYVGIDVNRAARIMSAGHGGQVLALGGTRQRLEGSGELLDLGDHRLKDLGAPHRLFQLGDRDFPPLRTLYRTNLPIQPTPLVGRERELAEAGELVRSNRLVTLTGPGGSGKTRLALQLAAEAAEQFPDGVFWVPLQAVRDPAFVERAIGTSVGADDGLVEYVANRRLLVLLDNFEQVVEAAPTVSWSPPLPTRRCSSRAASRCTSSRSDATRSSLCATPTPRPCSSSARARSPRPSARLRRSARSAAGSTGFHSRSSWRRRASRC